MCFWCFLCAFLGSWLGLNWYTNRGGYGTKGFVKDLHDYEVKRADFLKFKDATRKAAMQNCLSAMIEKYGNILKEMWDLFSLEEEKEIIRKYV